MNLYYNANIGQNQGLIGQNIKNMVDLSISYLIKNFIELSQTDYPSYF